MKISLFWIWLAGLGTINGFAQTEPRESAYTLRTGREIGLLGAGVVFNGAAMLLDQRSNPLTLIQIDELTVSSINAFDRGATRNWSPTAGRVSDVTLLGTAGVVGLVALPTLRMRKGYAVPLMYLETILLMNGVQNVVKETSLRTRPFVYNATAPLSEKITSDARRSFFSGHSAISFSSAVFASTVFGHYFPTSKLKPVVWVGSLGLASTTAVLRYTAGKHFPTDILAGAAVGSAIGWLVPKLHEPKRNATRAARHLIVSPWSNGLASGVYARMSL